MIVSDIDRAAGLAALAQFRPYLEDYVSKMETSLEVKVFKALEDKTLTPELALYAWMEKLSYRRLLRKYNSDVNIGQSAAKRAAKAMNLENGNG